MQVKLYVAALAACLFGMTGCQLNGLRGGGCDSGACGGQAGGCDSGACGGLTGLLGAKKAAHRSYGGINYGTTPETLTEDGYGTRGGHAGVLAAFHGRHHRGPQSHMGQYPGPADGPASPTMTYPYYTTRGPRDFFMDDPPTIGR